MKKISIVLFITLILAIHSFCLAENITLDISRDTKLSDVLYALALNSNHNIIINAQLDSMVKGRMQGNIYDILNYLSMTHNFNYKIMGENTILVTPTNNMTAIRSFPVRYANLNDIKEMLSLFIDAKKLNINVENSTIVVDGTQAQLMKVEEELAKIDQPTKQILLQVQMVELSNSDAEQLGLRYQMPTYSNDNYPMNAKSIKWGVSSEAKNIAAKGNVLARPSMVTPNGRRAIVKMVDQVPILTVNISDSGNRQTQVEYKEVGVTFIGTPRINVSDDGNESVTMSIRPIVSAIVDWVTSGDTKAPQIASREAETTVRVKSGETIVIGGLLKEEEMASLVKVPGLSELPILGGLFKYKDYTKKKSEVVIFITPVILNDDGSIPRELKTKDMPVTYIKNPNESSLKKEESLLKLDPQYNFAP